jgi:hypothetical protein
VDEAVCAAVAATPAVCRAGAVAAAPAEVTFAAAELPAEAAGAPAPPWRRSARSRGNARRADVGLSCPRESEHRRRRGDGAWVEYLGEHPDPLIDRVESRA